MSVNFDSDASLLEVARKHGKYVILPKGLMPNKLAYQVEIQGDWGVSSMAAWCQTVRNEKTRQEKEIEQQESETSSRRSQEDSPRDADEGADTNAEQRRGGGDTATEDSKDVEEKPKEFTLVEESDSIESIIQDKIEEVKDKLKLAHREYLSYKDLMDKYNKELDKLKAAQDAMKKLDKGK